MSRPPRPTAKTYSKKRGPYDRPQAERDSDSPLHEQGVSWFHTHTRVRHFFRPAYRSQHLREIKPRVGSSRGQSVSLVVRCTSIISDLTSWYRTTSAPQEPGAPPSPLLRPTELKVEPFCLNLSLAVDSAIRAERGSSSSPLRRINTNCTTPLRGRLPQ